MAGVKGRSGRKTTTNEAKRLAIIDKAWCVIGLFLNDETIPNEDKIKIARDLVVKNIPQQVDGLSFQQVVVMNDIKKGLEPLRFNIGSPDPTDPAQYTE